MNSWQSVIVMCGKRRECGASSNSLFALNEKYFRFNREIKL